MYEGVVRKDGIGAFAESYKAPLLSWSTGCAPQGIRPAYLLALLHIELHRESPLCHRLKVLVGNPCNILPMDERDSLLMHPA